MSPVNRILRYFAWEHLAPHLQEVSRPICEIAHQMARELPHESDELAEGLRKLLEAKDCLVRARLEARLPS